MFTNRRVLIAAIILFSTILILGIWLYEPKEYSINLDWNHHNHPSYVLYKKCDSDSFYLEKMISKPTSLFFEKEFAIEDYIVIPYKGKPTTKNELKCNDGILNQPQIITISVKPHSSNPNTTNLDFQFKRINAALDALYLGYQIEFNLTPITSNITSNSMRMSFVNDLYENLNARQLLDSNTTYAFPIDEWHDPSSQACVKRDENDGINYNFIFGDDAMMDLCFLFVHEFIHVIAGVKSDTHPSEACIINGKKYRNIMSVDDEFCRFALGKNEFQLINKYENYKLEEFCIGVEDSFRNCNSIVYSSITIEDWCAENTNNCYTTNSTFEGMIFRRGEEVRDIYSIQHDLYFKDIGNKEQFVIQAENSFMQKSINSIIIKEGLKDINEFKDVVKGNLIKYELNPNFENLNASEFLLIDDEKFEIVNEKFVYIKPELIKSNKNVQLENNPDKKIKSDDLLQKVGNF